MVTDCPLPSRTEAVVLRMGVVHTITPPQAKDTVPPPANAAPKLAWSQLVTVPPANAQFGLGPRRQNPSTSQAKSHDFRRSGNGFARLDADLEETGFA